MRKSKRPMILLIVLALMQFCTSVQSNGGTVFFEDFSGSDPGTQPVDWVVKASGGTLEVVSLNLSKKEQALHLNNTENVGMALMKRFPAYQGAVAVEMRFRYEKNVNNFTISLGAGNTEVFFITCSNQSFCTNGSGFAPFVNPDIRSGAWNTLRFVVNPNGSAEARVNSAMITGIQASGDYMGQPVDSITIKTNGGAGNWYVDYVQVESGRGLSAKVKPPQAPVVKDPVPQPLKDRINILYNNQYLYFDYQPVLFEGRVLLPFRSLYKTLGLDISWDQETNTATGRGVDITIQLKTDSPVSYVNGVEVLMDVPAKLLENRLYVPVRFVSESVGAKVSWENETQTVIIKN